MKKYISLLLSVIMCMSIMTACGSKEEASSSENAESSQAVSKLEEIKQKGKIVLGTSPDFAPAEFEDISSGEKKYVGSDIDLAYYIAEKLGVELEIKAMDFKSIQQAIVSDVVDMGISGFAPTAERKETLGLSIPYGMDPTVGQGLIVKKGEGAKYNSAESFSGKKIAAQNASLQMNLCNEQLPEDSEKKPIKAITDGILMVATDKVDALAASLDNAKSICNANPEVEIAEFKFDYTTVGTVVAVNKEETELLEAINEILEEVNEQGLYLQWKAEAIKLAESLNVLNN